MNANDPSVVPIVAAPGAEEVSLLEIRKKIYVRAVHGWFARWRWGLVFATQLIFYGLPWLTWNDRQAVLFEIAERKFYIFGLVLWPQDVIYLTALLVIAAFALFLFTAIAGRVWCGYACPQTVYTLIFQWIERKIEGERVARMKLDTSALSAPKFAKKAVKHLAWFAIALWTGYTFVGYFSPIRDLGFRAVTLPARAVGDVLDPVLRPRDLRQRRLHARAGVQVHVPVRTLPVGDVRPRHADHRLRPRARRAARTAQPQGGSRGREPRPLRRLQHLRAGVPDRHRHPQGPAVRMHRLRRVHRRLRPGDGQDGLPARADPLRVRERARAASRPRRHVASACCGRGR